MAGLCSGEAVESCVAAAPETRPDVLLLPQHADDYGVGAAMEAAAAAAALVGHGSGASAPAVAEEAQQGRHRRSPLLMYHRGQTKEFSRGATPAPLPHLPCLSPGPVQLRQSLEETDLNSPAAAHL